MPYGLLIGVLIFGLLVLLTLTAPRRPPFEEDTWIGRTISFDGGLAMEIVKSTERCAIPTNDPVTRERSPELLRHLRREHTLRFGVYARVTNAAPVETGAAFRFG
ncbi:MAG: MOSC domain-containing protein [Acidimicrobiia bacterium]|nr:MOSC domain-containing protein [Acidimicrobiia bacterium]